LPNGCVVCAGGLDNNDETLSSAEILEPPSQGATDATWTQRELPALSVERYGCCGCVLGDGRFAVLGGFHSSGQILSSCEAMAVGDGEHWEHPRQCTTRRRVSHVRLWPDASSSPVDMVSNQQQKCSTRCSTSGCSFRVIHRWAVSSIARAALCCRRPAHVSFARVCARVHVRARV